MKRIEVIGTATPHLPPREMVVEAAAVWSLSQFCDEPTMQCINGNSRSQYSMEAQLADFHRRDFDEKSYPEPDMYYRAVEAATCDFGKMKVKAMTFKTDMKKVLYRRGKGSRLGIL